MSSPAAVKVTRPVPPWTKDYHTFIETFDEYELDDDGTEIPCSHYDEIRAWTPERPTKPPVREGRPQTLHTFSSSRRFLPEESEENFVYKLEVYIFTKYIKSEISRTVKELEVVVYLGQDRHGDRWRECRKGISKRFFSLRIPGPLTNQDILLVCPRDSKENFSFIMIRYTEN